MYFNTNAESSTTSAVAAHPPPSAATTKDHIEPALDLARARAAADLDAKDVFTVRHGDTLFFGAHPEARDFGVRHPELVDTYSAYHTSKEPADGKDL